ncbi:extracellular solute-binding protein, partial [bacterium]|nr:extracellular solute-binding protein [bacterium]
MGRGFFSSFKLRFVFFAGASFFFIFGCGDNTKSGGSGRNVELVFWNTMSGLEAESLSTILDEFMAKNQGIKVVTEQVPFFQAQARFEQTAKAGIVPDVFRADRFWVTNFINSKLIEPLEESSNSRELSDILPAAREVVEKNGKIWGFPHTVDCLALFYNKNHFNEVRVTPPDDFDGFKKVSHSLTDRSKGRYGFFMNPDGWWFEPFFLGFGGRYFDGNG